MEFKEKLYSPQVPLPVASQFAPFLIFYLFYVYMYIGIMYEHMWRSEGDLEGVGSVFPPCSF